MPEKLDFITPTLMSVFGLFLEDPMQEYHEREVIRRTGVSKGSANKILRMLADLDFLIRERKGRMVFYKLDTEEPAVRQLKILSNIFMLRKLLSQLKRHSKKIVLFGSCAQGTDVKESDIDMLVLASEKSEKSAVREIISEFNQRNKRKIVPIVIDTNEFVELEREDKPLYENIERGIVLWKMVEAE